MTKIEVMRKKYWGKINGGFLTASLFILILLLGAGGRFVFADDTLEDGAELVGEADPGVGVSTIITGDANAETNIINLVNTTITESNGIFALLNVFSSLFGDIDLRGTDFVRGCPGECGLLSEDLTVMNTNKAEIKNDVVMRAFTGENSANSQGGEAAIITGDANAGANIVNIANTNIIGSNYLLLAFNNFGDWSGDLVLPSKYFFSKCCLGHKDVKIINENEANIVNNATSEASTGNNTAEGATSLILSGEANSATNIFNMANTNITEDNSVYIAFRFFGDWAGNVFSAPEGFSWTQTDDELLLINKDYGGSGGANKIDTKTDASNSNMAEIENNVQVYALTGENRAKGEGGARIASGEANSGVNIVNVANTNVLGRNWILALINIFGNWNGNIAFGRPDLWVGESVSEIPREIKPGEEMTYTLTVLNNGDTDATNVSLYDDFDERFLSPNSIGSGRLQDDRGVGWDLGTLAPGEARVMSYSVSVKENLPVGQTILSNTATLSLTESDNKTADNIERTSISLIRAPERGYASQALANFKITKTNSATSTIVRAGESVDYKILLKNDGPGASYKSKITDNLYFGAESEALDTREWELGTVYSGEEIGVTYTLQISPKTNPGIYRNEAKFTANDSSGVMRYVYIAESYIEVIAPKEEEKEISIPLGIDYVIAESKRAFDEAAKVIAMARETLNKMPRF